MVYIGTRIGHGKVAVNGHRVCKAGEKVDLKFNEKMVDNEPVRILLRDKYLWIMMNKSKDVIVTMRLMKVAETH